MANQSSVNSARFRVDSTPRRGDGQYVANFRLCIIASDGCPTEIYRSGDLAGFAQRSDAIAYAEERASRWLDGLALVIAMGTRSGDSARAVSGEGEPGLAERRNETPAA